MESLVHAMCFMDACGALAAPIVASLFISSGGDGMLGAMFPSVGLGIAVVSPTGFLVASLCGGKTYYYSSSGKDGGDRTSGKQEPEESDVRLFRLALFLFTTMTFLAAGMEKVMGMLLPTYAVSSGLDKAQGNLLTACFWGGYAASRFAAIFVASSRLDAGVTIYVDFALIAAPAVAPLLLDLSLEFLASCVALVGVGVGPLYSGLVTIFERRVGRITGDVSGILYVGYVVGQKVCVVATAQVVVAHPLAVFIFCLACVVLTLMVYQAAIWLSSKMHN